jgi:hypothetical protein
MPEPANPVAKDAAKDLGSEKLSVGRTPPSSTVFLRQFKFSWEKADDSNVNITIGVHGKAEISRAASLSEDSAAEVVDASKYEYTPVASMPVTVALGAVAIFKAGFKAGPKYLAVKPLQIEADALVYEWKCLPTATDEEKSPNKGGGEKVSRTPRGSVKRVRPGRGPAGLSGPTVSSANGASFKVALQYANATDLGRWGADYGRQESVELSDRPIDNRWKEPPSAGLPRLYGAISFGESTKVKVIIDENEGYHSIARIAFDDDTRFDDKLARTFPCQIEFAVKYADGTKQPYAIELYYFRSQRAPAEVGARRLFYHRKCLREGLVMVNRQPRPIAILDENSDGDYADLATTTVMTDVANTNGERNEQAIHSGRSALALGNKFYVVSEIARDGSNMTLKEAVWGQLKGAVLDQQGMKPIRGAELVATPGGLSAKTDAEGHFLLELPEGEYTLLTAKARGFIPRHDENGFVVKGGTDQVLSDVLLRAANAPPGGRIRLNSGNSYDFLGQAISQYSGGDFSYNSGRGSASFYAGNRYQKGMVDMGMLGNMPLRRVVPPAAGYNKYGIPAVLGHTYVSNAKDGEDGHFIIFRIVNFGADGSVEIDYYYR